MNIFTQYLPLNPAGVKGVRRAAVSQERAKANTDASKQTIDAQQKVFKKRSGDDRRKRNVKVLLDTRTGRDRRYDIENPSIDVRA